MVRRKVFGKVSMKLCKKMKDFLDMWNGVTPTVQPFYGEMFYRYKCRTCFHPLTGHLNVVSSDLQACCMADNCFEFLPLDNLDYLEMLNDRKDL